MRRRLALALPVVTAAGFATRLDAGSATPWLRDLAGGILYEVFWILLALLLWPRLAPGRVALAVLGVTCLLELLQLWRPPPLEALRATFLGHAVIGSTFSPWDFPAYLLGCLAGAWLGRRLLESRS